MLWSKNPILPFITLLVILSVSFYLTNADGQCSNPPPGVIKMFRGVDITTLDLVPLDIIGDRGIKNPVIDFTCRNGTVWTSPSGVTYQLPDQISKMTTTPGGWKTAKAVLLKYREDLRKWLNINVGLKGAYEGFYFSSSQSYQKIQHTLVNTERYVEDVTAFELATRADFVPDWVLKLDRHAQLYVERTLKGTFESNRDVYETFIREYGTHYFSNANFGGLLRNYMETNKNYVYSKSDEDIKVAAEASYSIFVSGHGGVVSGSTKISESFRKATTVRVMYFGGSADFNAKKDGIKTWQSTVHDDPWLFSGKLRPISDLIRDSIKKENLVKAVNEHVMRSYLEELQRMVSDAKNKVTDDYLTTLQVKIEKMQESTTLVKEKVDALSNDVEHNLIVPQWFWVNTKLCFKWRAVGDDNQCGGGVGRKLCSKPNSRTEAYLDDTDGRDGSCRMQWGITSHNNPNWFDNIKICYKWLQFGGGKQCGGKVYDHVCAEINSFTREYQDDTDGRGGGCFMFWKLEVPSDAPVWIKTSSLCYYWYSECNNAQCGLGSNKILCATANKWTSHYRDDTDGRSGGCKMSWELKVNTVVQSSKVDEPSAVLEFSEVDKPREVNSSNERSASTKLTGISLFLLTFSYTLMIYFV